MCIQKGRTGEKYRKFKACPPGSSGGQTSVERVRVGVWSKFRTAGAVGGPARVSEGVYLDGERVRLYGLAI